MDEILKKKVDAAIKLIQSASLMAKKANQPLEVAYSGGKDSDVILELVKLSGVEYRAIYKNTTIDPPGTIAHVKEMGVEILRPKHTFFEIIEKHGMPNMFKRFCCGYLKEYKVLDYAIVGIRRCESRKRMERYKEPEQCRVYSKTKKVRQYMPILYWTDDDIANFIKERNIKLAPVYYNENGCFDVSRRLGCLCCPMLDNARIEQFKKFPNMVKAYIRSLRIFRETHPNAKSVVEYADEYEHFVRDVFYWRLTQEKWNSLQKNSLLPPPKLQGFVRKLF